MRRGSPTERTRVALGEATDAPRSSISACCGVRGLLPRTFLGRASVRRRPGRHAPRRCRQAFAVLVESAAGVAYRGHMAHEVEHRTLARFLEEHSLKHTKQREAILDVFLEVEGHVTSDDLYQRVRAVHPQIGYTTVYPTASRVTRSPTSTTITWCVCAAARSSSSSAR
jgi:hypothetical protein